MISSCGSTLQELDDVTKKYRDIAIEEGKEDAASIEKRKKTLDDVARRIKVNWKKVRWDQEKQSLQQYREKLRSHTEAINLILSSIIWSVFHCPWLLTSLTTYATSKVKRKHSRIE